MRTKNEKLTQMELISTFFKGMETEKGFIRKSMGGGGSM